MDLSIQNVPKKLIDHRLWGRRSRKAVKLLRHSREQYDYKVVRTHLCEQPLRSGFSQHKFHAHFEALIARFRISLPLEWRITQRRWLATKRR
jgi:hypothetical protein